MRLIFRIFSKGVIANLEIEKPTDGVWVNGWYMPTEDGFLNEKIALGYHLFDTDFFRTDLEKILSLIKTADDLSFLCGAIPKFNVLYPEIDGKGARSGDMGLHSRDDLSSAEKLKYFAEHKDNCPKTYIYHCKSDRDVAVAELHFYITQNYKLTTCKLCGKPFFTNSLKVQYCERIGESPDYPKYSCNKARELIRNAKSAHRETASMRKVIMNTLSKYPKTREEEYYIFIREDEIRKDKLSKGNYSYAEYASWLYEQYKLYVPRGRKKPITNNIP